MQNYTHKLVHIDEKWKNFYIILDTLKFYTYSNALIFKSF